MNTDDFLETAAQVLIRCTVMGVIVLLFWWGALELFGDVAYSAHERLFPISREQFTVIHYVGILMTKAAVALLFFFPYIAIKLVLKKRKNLSSDQTETGA